MEVGLFLAFCTVSVLAALLARAGLNRRIAILEEKAHAQQSQVDLMQHDFMERNLNFATVVANSVAEAMRPFSEKLERQDNELAEIKDMCCYLVSPEIEG